MFYAFEGHVPAIGKNVYVDDTACVIGRVTLADDVVVLPHAVIRGDYEAITIGASCIIEDGCILHVDDGGLVLGESVVLGHGAIVHGARIGSRSLIGMGATVLKGAVIGEGCLIAAGALVTEDTQVSPGSLVMGVPAKVVRPVSEAQRAYIKFAHDYYLSWGESCRAGKLQPVEPRSLDEGAI